MKGMQDNYKDDGFDDDNYDEDQNEEQTPNKSSNTNMAGLVGNGHIQNHLVDKEVEQVIMKSSSNQNGVRATAKANKGGF